MFNLEGAGGTVGLQRLVNEKGNADMLMQMGLGVVGAQFSNKSEATLDQTTPIAKLIEEAEAIVVPATPRTRRSTTWSTAWKADPGNTPVGGASNPGGPDHLTPMLLAQGGRRRPRRRQLRRLRRRRRAAGRHPRATSTFAATGIGEVAEPAAAGDVRILAVTSEEPVEGVDAPTLTDEGIDLVFANWRGIVAPPGLNDADTTEVGRRGHQDARQRGLEEGAGGPAAGPTPSSPATSSAVPRRGATAGRGRHERAGPGMSPLPPPAAPREQGRSEYGVALFLGALGLLVIVQALLPAGEPDRPSARSAPPPSRSSSAACW